MVLNTALKLMFRSRNILLWNFQCIFIKRKFQGMFFVSYTKRSTSLLCFCFSSSISLPSECSPTNAVHTLASRKQAFHKWNEQIVPYSNIVCTVNTLSESTGWVQTAALCYTDVPLPRTINCITSEKLWRNQNSYYCKRTKPGKTNSQ